MNEPPTIDASRLRALLAEAAWLDADPPPGMIYLTMNKSWLCNSVIPSQSFFRLTNAYLEPEIVGVPMCAGRRKPDFPDPSAMLTGFTVDFR